MQEQKDQYKEPYKNDINSLLSSTNLEFQQGDEKIFTNEAFDLVKKKISEYINDLLGESRRNSQRQKDEAIMVSHVEKASNYLTSKKRGVGNQLLGTLGGVFLGATMSNLLSLLLNGGNIGVTALITIVVFAIVGSFMVAISLTGK